MKFGNTSVPSLNLSQDRLDDRLEAVAAEPVRVLYMRDSLTVWGPGKTILNTWRTIDRSRFQLTVVATRPAKQRRNELLDNARRLGADTIELSIGRGLDLIAVWRLVRLLRRHQIAILQTHDAQTRRIGTIAAALTGVYHVTSVHGWIFNNRREKLAKWLDARLIARANSVIAVSAHLRDELQAAAVPGDKITVLRNAIVLGDYVTAAAAAAVRRDLEVPEGNYIIAIVGRLSPEKGHDVFLKAARRVIDELPHVTFLVVGSGPLVATLKRQVASLKLERHVVFKGHRPDLSGIYRATDVLVLSSFTEGIPNVLLESFAYGRPAVASAVGGVPEVLVDGENGWLVRPGDDGAIASRVLRLLKNSNQRRRMGEAGRTTIERHFSFERRTALLVGMYDRILSSRVRHGQS
jgi:glycosyltransferase involved in cell wall biosynthesis